MKEYLNLTKQNEKPIKASYAAIMKIESDTTFKLLEEREESPLIRYGTGATDPEESVSEPRLGVWLVALAMLCLLVSYWVISRQGWF